MSEAADDLFDAAMNEEETRNILRSLCSKSECKWEIDDDGLFVCKVCGLTTDI